jgi:hypothetical protein
MRAHGHIISLRREVWAIKTSLTPPFLLKCLHQTRKASGHVFVGLGYRFCLFLRFWYLALCKHFNKNGGVKLVLMAQTSLLSEMMWPCKCFPLVSKMPTCKRTNSVIIKNAISDSVGTFVFISFISESGLMKSILYTSTHCIWRVERSKWLLPVRVV